MSKVKPPKEIFDQWTPEQQKEYNDTYVEPAKQRREEHQNNIKELNASGPILDENDPTNRDTSVERQNRMALADAGHEDPGSPDGTSAFKISLVAQTGNDPKYDQQRRNELAKEEEAWHKANLEVASVTIDEKESEGLPYEIKHNYEQQLLKAIEDCENGIEKSKEKLRKKQQELEDKWFDFTKFPIQQDIESLEKHIKQLESDLAFNKKCLANSFPPPPEPPAPPAMPSIQTFVHTGAKLSCPLAIPCGAPSLVVDPSRKVFIEGAQMGNIMDFKPLLNIPSMGQCTTMSNPAVAAATAAKLGVYTPAPCVPATTAPWKPGDSTVLVENFPALLNTDTLQCMWGGVITILPG